MLTLSREQWEEPGYEIGAHTNSPPVNPAELLYTVNHYPAVTTITTDDPIVWFRNVQRGYVNDPRRGYSLGYSWGYWPDGTELEVRGWDYRNAANDVPDDPADENENRVSVSLLIVVAGMGDQGQPATLDQLQAVAHRLADVHARCGRTLPNIVHGDLEPTQCAGAGVNAQTRAGLFLPAPPPPSTEVPDMLLIRVIAGNEYAGFTVNDTGVFRWVMNGREYDGWLAAGAVEKIIPPAEFQSMVRYGRTIGDINPDVTHITGITAEQWNQRKLIL